MCTQQDVIVCHKVADADGILGIVYTENIQVTAEAYDVALDITFPKGSQAKQWLCFI